MNSDSTKQKILLAAGPIFARKGFAKATVREICEAAGVNLASINYYFGDKAKLYAETILAAQAIQVQQNPQPVFDSDLSPEEKLRQLIATLLRRMMAMQSEPWPVRLIMREVLQPSPASQGLIEVYFRPFFESLLEVIDELLGFQPAAGMRLQIGFSIVGQCQIYRTSAEMMSRMLSPAETQQFQIQALTEHIAQFSLAAIAGLRLKLADPLFPNEIAHG